MDEIEKDKNTPLSPVTARLIALRRPAGAAEAIIGFLPFTDDPLLLNEIQAALDAVVVTDGKTDPAAVRALDDHFAVRRGAAAEALCVAARSEPARNTLRLCAGC